MPILPLTSKRADARRNIEAIVAAATTLLAADPDASVQDIAKSAGVGRVTLYGHFDSRASLIAEVGRRAIALSEESLRDVDLDGDPPAAMGRLLEATWHLTHRFGAIVVAADHALPAEEMRRAHEKPEQRVRSLLERGREQGRFRTDMPVAWQIATIHALLHAAAGAVHQGRMSDTQAPRLVRDTVLAAIAVAE